MVKKQSNVYFFEEKIAIHFLLFFAGKKKLKRKKGMSFEGPQKGWYNIDTPSTGTGFLIENKKEVALRLPCIVGHFAGQIRFVVLRVTFDRLLAQAFSPKKFPEGLLERMQKYTARIWPTDETWSVHPKTGRPRNVPGEPHPISLVVLGWLRYVDNADEQKAKDFIVKDAAVKAKEEQGQTWDIIYRWLIQTYPQKFALLQYQSSIHELQKGVDQGGNFQVYTIEAAQRLLDLSRDLLREQLSEGGGGGGGAKSYLDRIQGLLWSATVYGSPKSLKEDYLRALQNEQKEQPKPPLPKAPLPKPPLSKTPLKLGKVEEIKGNRDMSGSELEWLIDESLKAFREIGLPFEVARTSGLYIDILTERVRVTQKDYVENRDVYGYATQLLIQIGDNWQTIDEKTCQAAIVEEKKGDREFKSKVCSLVTDPLFRLRQLTLRHPTTEVEERFPIVVKNPLVVYIPVNTGGHWCLVVLTSLNREMIWWDPLTTSYPQTRKEVELLGKTLQEFLGWNNTIHEHRRKVQSDGFTCGSLVRWGIESHIGWSLDKWNERPPSSRSIWVNSLIEFNLLGGSVWWLDRPKKGNPWQDAEEEEKNRKSCRAYHFGLLHLLQANGKLEPL
jgi:hypothetical protein